jgi:hypothetical protein
LRNPSRLVTPPRRLPRAFCASGAAVILVPKRRLHDDSDILDALAKISPEARRLVEILKARHRGGRRPVPEANFRKIELWWKSFRKRNSELTPEDACNKFHRLHGRQVEKLLGIKRGNRTRRTRMRGPIDCENQGAILDRYDTFRKAVARGAKETNRVNARRQETWKIGLTSLGEVLTHGKRRRVYTDPQEYVLVEAAMRRALLGER